MNIAHDHKTSRVGRPQGRADDTSEEGRSEEARPAIDWQDLRSRLFAARQFPAVIASAAAPDSRPLRLRIRGSFDGCAASALNTYEEGSASVNRTASSYLKPGGDNVSSVAGNSSTGRRG